MSKKQFIAVELIKTTGLQMRAAINMDVVREYAESEREHKAVFPPLTVFQDKAGNYWLADGFHRLGSYKQNGKKKICCEVHEGEFVDALRYALGANVTHGMRRTTADKANAVKVAYENRKRLGLPDVPAANLIADLVGVDNHTAANQLGNFPCWKAATERTGADGKTRTLPPPPTRRPSAGMAAAVAEQDEEKAEVEAPPPPVRKPGPPPVRGSSGTPPATGVVIHDEAHREAPKREVKSELDPRGVMVPFDLMELWNRRGEMTDLAGLVSKVRCALKAAQEGADPLYGEVNYSSVLGHLNMAYEEITACVPWCVCSCQGVGCRLCKDRGVMGKDRYNKCFPKELK